MQEKIRSLLVASRAGDGLLSRVTPPLVLFLGLLVVLVPSASWAQSLVAAVLPSSRSVGVGTPATAFATIINTGSSTATGCSIALLTAVAATFTYQTTNRTTNDLAFCEYLLGIVSGNAALTCTEQCVIAPCDASCSCSSLNSGEVKRHSAGMSQA